MIDFLGLAFQVSLVVNSCFFSNVDQVLRLVMVFFAGNWIRALKPGPVLGQLADHVVEVLLISTVLFRFFIFDFFTLINWLLL